MTTENTTPSYYIVIPANVRYDKNLSFLEKFLYGEIDVLAREKGYCYATNRYFAELYDYWPQQISTAINHLNKYGYIKITNELRPDGSTQRKLSIKRTWEDKNIDTKTFGKVK